MITQSEEVTKFHLLDRKNKFHEGGRRTERCRNFVRGQKGNLYQKVDCNSPRDPLKLLTTKPNNKNNLITQGKGFRPFETNLPLSASVGNLI